MALFLQLHLMFTNSSIESLIAIYYFLFNPSKALKTSTGIAKTTVFD